MVAGMGLTGDERNQRAGLIAPCVGAKPKHQRADGLRIHPLVCLDLAILLPNKRRGNGARQDSIHGDSLVAQLRCAPRTTSHSAATDEQNALHVTTS